MEQRKVKKALATLIVGYGLNKNVTEQLGSTRSLTENERAEIAFSKIANKVVKGVKR